MNALPKIEKAIGRIPQAPVVQFKLNCPRLTMLPTIHSQRLRSPLLRIAKTKAISEVSVTASIATIQT
jgi:hypothetical protein